MGPDSCHPCRHFFLPPAEGAAAHSLQSCPVRRRKDTSFLLGVSQRTPLQKHMVSTSAACGDRASAGAGWADAAGRPGMCAPKLPGFPVCPNCSEERPTMASVNCPWQTIPGVALSAGPAASSRAALRGALPPHTSPPVLPLHFSSLNKTSAPSCFPGGTRSPFLCVFVLHLQLGIRSRVGAWLWVWQKGSPHSMPPWESHSGF